ncbi:uncharacterized protein [Henckelia pumila]|uniref:uncharacterized protein n=1 Tax=Henckelia pumila TaxID=405737 RepID=UPI003C6E7425
MQSAKESAANVAASARSGMEKTKATVLEKAEQIKTRDPMMKDMATQKKEAKIQQAEREKQGAVQQNRLAKHEGAAGGYGHGFTAIGDTATGTGGHNNLNPVGTGGHHNPLGTGHTATGTGGHGHLNPLGAGHTATGTGGHNHLNPLGTDHTAGTGHVGDGNLTGTGHTGHIL